MNVIRKVALITLFTALISYTLYNVYQKQFSTQKQNKELTQQLGTSSLEIGQIAPAFSTEDLNGNHFSLEQVKSKKIILNFWATWCPPCKEEIPNLVTFNKQNNLKDITLISINLTNSESVNINEIKQFVKQHEMNYSVLLDENGQIAKKYQVISIPTTFVLNQDGVILSKHLGALTMDELIKISK